MISLFRVTCLAGPWHDVASVRFIEAFKRASLYDLHVVIQQAVSFDDEFEFIFFQAASPTGKHRYIPDGVDPRDGVDTDIYEDVTIEEALPQSKRLKLYYLFNLTDKWLFEIELEKEEKKPSPHEFYPRVRFDLNIGPDPMQYGNAPDDYSPSDELEPPIHDDSLSFFDEDRDEAHFGEEQEEEEDVDGGGFQIHSAFGLLGADDYDPHTEYDDEDQDSLDDVW